MSDKIKDMEAIAHSLELRDKIIISLKRKNNRLKRRVIDSENGAVLAIKRVDFEAMQAEIAELREFKKKVIELQKETYGDCMALHLRLPTLINQPGDSHEE